MSTDEEKYYSMYCDSLKKNVELKPGTEILGARYSGFYDSYGLIIQADYIGSSREKLEEWAYWVLYYRFGAFHEACIFPSLIQSVESEPIQIIKFNIFDNTDLDELLNNGEQDLFDYFIIHPDKLNDIHPKQFEKLVLSIYKNQGFNVESVGAWNQADGGIDIVAISKSFSGFEYKLAIQCKVSRNKISARPIRELAGVLNTHEFHQGVVATTSSFTKNAINEKLGHYWNIDLVDRNKLLSRMCTISPLFKKIRRKAASGGIIDRLTSLIMNTQRDFEESDPTGRSTRS